MVRAAGTLANGTASAGRTAPVTRSERVGMAGSASMAEWQMSQSGQLALCSWLHALDVPSSHAAAWVSMSAGAALCA
ncbi:hypothetical protein AcdelDRAFT_1718 [Acidovorax delafieldii 2AN]|uniref:Uncharacterized protein n=1 Tax=Acidovorax delafieldii 2AN TaxID=573060 RepID=C5T488_ACIDE|nr:hypothetical protein [Acidovorax delafieldii]EER60691.1 hypothetical protein AcdelDRAFT_1718 [Acidovorax delafieldii 2AN]